MGRKPLGEGEKKEFVGLRLKKKYVDKLKSEGDLRVVIERIVKEHISKNHKE